MKDDLFTFLRQSLTPAHAAENLASVFRAAGFSELHEIEPWSVVKGGAYFVRRGGAFGAFLVGADPSAGWSIAVAHTDSPGWKLKLPTQRLHATGMTRIGTEVYGSPIHSTWFDRPLAVAGEVHLKTSRGQKSVLVSTDALGVFPNLAIHYNREVNKGQAYDLTEHLSLLVSLSSDADLQHHLARTHDFDPDAWSSADLMVVNASAPELLGSQGFFVSPRIDNMTGCHAIARGLLNSKAQSSTGTRMVLCFDQEEVGSATWTGADSGLLGDWMRRIHECSGGTSEDYFRAKAGSFILSVDSAHGLHPNWPAQNDEAYSPLLGHGPVIKSSARFSYATTAATEAVLRRSAETAGVGVQSFVMKSTLVPGSTVGPLTTSGLGIPGADIGIPIWAMHSSIETAHLSDQEELIKLLGSYFLRPL